MIKKNKGVRQIWKVIIPLIKWAGFFLLILFLWWCLLAKWVYLNCMTAKEGSWNFMCRLFLTYMNNYECLPVWLDFVYIVNVGSLKLCRIHDHHTFHQPFYQPSCPLRWSSEKLLNIPLKNLVIEYDLFSCQVSTNVRLHFHLKSVSPLLIHLLKQISKSTAL